MPDEALLWVPIWGRGLAGLLIELDVTLLLWRQGYKPMNNEQTNNISKPLGAASSKGSFKPWRKMVVAFLLVSGAGVMVQRQQDGVEPQPAANNAVTSAGDGDGISTPSGTPENLDNQDAGSNGGDPNTDTQVATAFEP